MLYGDVSDVAESFGADVGSRRGDRDALQGGMSEGEADFAGGYAEYDGVLFEGV